MDIKEIIKKYNFKTDIFELDGPLVKEVLEKMGVKSCLDLIENIEYYYKLSDIVNSYHDKFFETDRKPKILEKDKQYAEIIEQLYDKGHIRYVHRKLHEIRYDDKHIEDCISRAISKIEWSERSSELKEKVDKGIISFDELMATDVSCLPFVSDIEIFHKYDIFYTHDLMSFKENNYRNNEQLKEIKKVKSWIIGKYHLYENNDEYEFKVCEIYSEADKTSKLLNDMVNSGYIFMCINNNLAIFKKRKA